VYAVRLAAGKIGATQDSFARAIGVSVKTLRNWEQRRRKPTGPALALLSLIQKNPRIVLDAMNG
jgi:putative transcriptional regulator